MKFEAVIAGAFGPFRDRRIDFSPGLNILYGLNEAGKSSWHAAIFAGLCGVRRGRGSRKEDELFAERHKPWNGGGWRVGAVISLEADGRHIELSHDLEGRVDSRVFDAVLAGRSYVSEIINDGAPDGARFLGLDRQSFLVTACVRQSEILGVLDNPEALRQYIQRAAASSTADGTAAEALGRIESFRRAHVGFERRHAVGPLQREIDRAEAARLRIAGIQMNQLRIEELAANVDANEESLRSREDSRKAAEAAISAAEAQSLQVRYERARDLAADFPDGPPKDLPSDEADAREVSAALAAWAKKPQIPVLIGESAEELDRALLRLPNMPVGDTVLDAEVAEAYRAMRELPVESPAVPEGDIAPDPDVLHAHAAWLALGQHPRSSIMNGPSAEDLAIEIAALPGIIPGDLTADGEVIDADAALRAVRQSVERLTNAEPPDPAWPDLHGLQYEEVARLCEVLNGSSIPERPEARVYTQIPYDHARAVSSQPVENRQSFTRSWIVGGLLLATLVAAFLQIWWFAGTAGVISVGLLILWRAEIQNDLRRIFGGRQFEAAIPGIGTAPDAGDEAQHRLNDAKHRLMAVGLPIEPAGLNELLDLHRIAQRIAPRRQEWERQGRELADDVHRAQARLHSALDARGVPANEDPVHAVAEYKVACTERAASASIEARRPDLERRLADRRRVEFDAIEMENRCRAAEVRLTEALHARGVPEFDNLGNAVAEYQDSCLRNAEIAQAFEDLERGRRSTRERLSAALRARGAPISDDLRVSFDDYEGECTQRAVIAQEALRRPDLARLRDDRERAEKAAQEAREFLATLGLRLAGLAFARFSEKMEPEQAAVELSDWLLRRDQNVQIAEERRSRWASLQAALGSETLEMLAEKDQQYQLRAQAERETCSPEAFERAWSASDRTAHVKNCREAENQARDAVAHARAQLDESRRAFSQVVEHEEELVRANDEIARLRQLDATLGTADRFLREAQESIHRDIAPKLAAAIGPRLGKITGGRYHEVKVDPESLAVDVRAPDGVWRNARLLSHGTAEQIYLLLRVALSEHLAKSGETCPLILDDVTVQSDGVRTVEILEALHFMSAERQIILFTQEEDVRVWARDRLNLPCDSFVELAALSS